MKRIPLTRGQFALVDDADFDSLNQWKWFATWDPCTHQFRAVRAKWSNGRSHHFSMHRQIMRFPEGRHIDHINSKTLDNRRSNLRICTPTENRRNQRRSSKNSSGFKGADRHQGKWRARITVNYSSRHLGCFSSPVDAALVYDKAALEFFGQFARINFPNFVS
jgi:hypothetical protein